VLGPYLDEAVRLFEQGVAAERIERAALLFGLPMGPLELLDEVGLDIAAHAAASLHAAYGERMRSSPLAGELVAAGHRGKKSGSGFFTYALDPKSGRARKGALNPVATSKVRASGVELSDEVLRDRLALALVAEAARCLEEHVVASEAELDLATVFGMGFPPFEGGALRYVRSRGARSVVERLATLAALPDVASRDGARARFDACEALHKLARE